ncbi:tetratricopeptide repeat protein [Streptomyces sp. NPDC127068]|uniref:tetratricopeptide repeat protein n=1 Tax=Streptomyces sp. NPDC127068 TaxID=3347127 RepID=UPI00364CFE29
MKIRLRLVHWLVAHQEHDRARALLEELLSLQIRAKGETSGEALATRGRIADLLVHTGDSTRAVTELRAMLTAHLDTVGPDHPRTLATRRRLAHALHDISALVEAAAQLDELSRAYGRAGNREKEAALRARAERVAAEASGGVTPPAPEDGAPAPDDLVAALAALAPDDPQADDLLRRSADATGAAPPVVRALDDLVARWSAVLPVHTPLLVTARLARAEVKGQLGQRSTAAEEIADLADVLRQHPEVAPTRLAAVRRRLAHWQEAAGDHRGASATIEAALEAQLRTSDPAHRKVLSLRARLATVRTASGDHVGAVVEYRILIAAATAAHGPTSRIALDFRTRLATALTAVGDSAGALTVLRQVLEHRTALRGPDSSEVAAARRNLAVALVAAGRRPEAVTLLADTATEYEQRLGPAHPHSLAARQQLAVVRHDGGDLPGALADLTLVVARRQQVQGGAHAQTRTAERLLTEWTATAGGAARARTQGRPRG